eukprot:INCI10476.1.p4 GENE.INCI10476.1~~INCI10476.1.p4  ORF type:complete len:113 (+),score=15.67 INCI10476.1:174-512(+)
MVLQGCRLWTWVKCLLVLMLVGLSVSSLSSVSAAPQQRVPARSSQPHPGRHVKRKPIHYHERIKHMDEVTKARVRALRDELHSSSHEDKQKVQRIRSELSALYEKFDTRARA